MRRRLAILILASSLLTTAPLGAAERSLDPLLQLLVTKGVLTEAEARALAEEAATAQTPAAAAPAELPAGLKGLKIGALAYVSYQDGTQNTGGGQSGYSKLVLKRGYVDIRKEITRFFSARVTPDVTLDTSGDSKLRLKYIYGQFQRPQLGFLGKPYVELGMAHMPWLDFEEHVNLFRMQDTMYLERNGLFNSADLGVLVGANLGPELPEDYRSSVSSAYAGRWGSFALGVYNGGGYHAAEKNSNKVVEGRLSLRPLPDVVPGLQLSVFGLAGKGNIEETADVEAPDWDLLAAMLSYESRRLALTGQYSIGSGNQKGLMVDADGNALDHRGCSLFAEVRLDQDKHWSAFARHDHFDPATEDPNADVTDRGIIGLAWQFTKGNYWVLDYDRLDHDLASLGTEDRLQLTLQIKY